MFRRAIDYSAFGEGWALYCESLGKELGFYQDPYQYFGMLSMAMHRAIRLVVDTGLHAKGWTREEAIQYSLDHEPLAKAHIVQEIERYMVYPGQALSYKIGQLKILELRERAAKALGPRFDIREFHSRILESGCLPFESSWNGKLSAGLPNRAEAGNKARARARKRPQFTALSFSPEPVAAQSATPHPTRPQARSSLVSPARDLRPGQSHRRPPSTRQMCRPCSPWYLSGCPSMQSRAHGEESPVRAWPTAEANDHGAGDNDVKPSP
jgi:hypothetical protein